MSRTIPVILAIAYLFCTGCLMLDPGSETVSDKSEQLLIIEAGDSSIGPLVFDITAQNVDTAVSYLHVMVYLRAPGETEENRCDDLDLGEYDISLQLSHPASSSTQESSFTASDCRSYVVGLELNCSNDPGTCSKRVELQIEATGLTKEWRGQLEVVAMSDFEPEAPNNASIEITPEL